MSTPFKQVNARDEKASANRDLFAGPPTQEVLTSTHTAELVIALCGPIGSPLHDVADMVKDVLATTFSYEKCEVIRLSNFIVAQARRANRPIRENPAQRRHDLITLGNQMRQLHGASVLAELAVNEIRLDRELNGKEAGAERFIPRRVCHIIDSIKNQGELELLRTVYREALYVIGVFAPVDSRERALANQGLTAAEIGTLIDRDSGEEIAEGQAVRDTFPQCDFFLRMESNTEALLRGRVERFLHLILATKVITPTRAETAMYAAASAAGNSACLSRQVGAAVTDDEGEILAIGWNDVPRAFGDLYVTDLATDPTGQRDMRCWNNGGKCYNDEEKSLLASRIVDTLGDLIPAAKKADAIDKVREDKKLGALIEFSRSVHAEMHAILTALRQKGDRVHGGRIYVTTYPCHACARHIVAAGIKAVYYIEPYKKSLATKLHGDAISESEESTDRVRIVPFDGVAPSRYLSLFRMKPDSRKADGRMIRISPDVATPKLEKSLEALPALEGLVVRSLRERSLIDSAPPPGASANDNAGTTPA